MKEKIKTFLLFTLLVTTPFIVGYLVVGTADYFDYQSLWDTSYATPWYNSSWIKQPYTNLRLSFGKPQFCVTTNAVGDTWFVKETEIKGKTFWTIVQTIKKSE